MRTSDLITRVKKKSIVRGVDPFSVETYQLDSIVDAAVDSIQDIVIKRKAKEFWIPWGVEKIRFKPIPRLEKTITRISDRLNQIFPVSIVFTERVGPEYVYHSKSKGEIDFVHVPKPSRFHINKYFYKTFLHELTHAALGKYRAKIEFNKPDEEEITVEITSLIISFLSGINVWDHSLAYIQNRAYGPPNTNYANVLGIKTNKQWSIINRRSKYILKYMLC